jgi:hypothetical protein
MPVRPTDVRLPPAGRAPAPAAAPAGSRIGLVWGAVVGLAVGVTFLIIVVAIRGPGSGPNGPGEGQGGGTGAGGAGGGVDGSDAVPGVGGDVFLAGGVARLPVPQGWTVIARADRVDDPSGYSEIAVLANRGSGVRLAAYLLGEAESPADALVLADERAREWIRDGRDAQVDPASRVDPFGKIAGAASVTYRYALDGALEGEVVAAIRSDGVTLLVFVDAPRGTLEQNRNGWQPVRDAVLKDFAG